MPTRQMLTREQYIRSRAIAKRMERKNADPVKVAFKRSILIFIIFCLGLFYINTSFADNSYVIDKAWVKRVMLEGGLLKASSSPEFLASAEKRGILTIPTIPFLKLKIGNNMIWMAYNEWQSYCLNGTNNNTRYCYQIYEKVRMRIAFLNSTHPGWYYRVLVKPAHDGKPKSLRKYGPAILYYVTGLLMIDDNLVVITGFNTKKLYKDLGLDYSKR